MTHNLEQQAIRSQRTQVLPRLAQQIISANVRGVFSHQLHVDLFAIEPLLQRPKRIYLARAHDKQFAIDGRIAKRIRAERFHHLGKSGGNIVARARIKPPHALAFSVMSHNRLHADAIPLPFGHEVFRIKRGEVVLKQAQLEAATA